MNELLAENEFAASIQNPPLVISSGPQEIPFSGQSEAGQTALGTSFIQGTGSGQTAVTMNPLVIVGLVILAVLIMRHVR